MAASETPEATTRRGESLAQLFLPRLMKLASVQPGERVLDIACGEGEATVEAMHRSGKTGEVVAIDRQQAAIDGTVSRARAAGLEPPRTLIADPAQLNLPESYYDIVLCNFGLTALPDVEAAIKEIQRLMRPVARFAVATLGQRERCPFITIFADAVAKHVPAIAAEVRSLFRFGEAGSLAQLLSSLGFEDAVPERLTEWPQFHDLDAYWQTLTATTTLGRFSAQLTPEAEAECRAEIEKKLKFYRRGDHYEIKVEAAILACVR